MARAASRSSRSAASLQFTLPGTPLFPALPDDSILKPTLDWQLVTDKAGPLNAELAYVTGGMTWKAAYNVVSPEVGDTLDLTGLGDDGQREWPDI